MRLTLLAGVVLTVVASISSSGAAAQTEPDRVMRDMNDVLDAGRAAEVDARAAAVDGALADLVAADRIVPLAFSELAAGMSAHQRARIARGLRGLLAIDLGDSITRDPGLRFEAAGPSRRMMDERVAVPFVVEDEGRGAFVLEPVGGEGGEGYRVIDIEWAGMSLLRRQGEVLSAALAAAGGDVEVVVGAVEASVALAEPAPPQD